MRFKHQISITAETGVGSSTLLGVLQEKLKSQPYRWVSGGGVFRERAAKVGMPLDQFVLHCRLHPEEGHDDYCDGVIAEMALQDWLVCEARIPHVLMPGAFKVLQKCRVALCAERRQRDLKTKTVDEVLEVILARDHNDRLRNEARRPGCIWTEDRFNLVVDSELARPGEIADFILEEHREWCRDRVRPVRA